MSFRPPRFAAPAAPQHRPAPSPQYGWPKGSDRRWRKLRARKLADEPRCERCMASGRITLATEVHHLLPISQGGAKYDYANLQSVCGRCQDEAHGARIKGARPDGTPRDPAHPWNAR